MSLADPLWKFHLCSYRGAPCAHNLKDTPRPWGCQLFQSLFDNVLITIWEPDSPHFVDNLAQPLPHCAPPILPNLAQYLLMRQYPHPHASTPQSFTIVINLLTFH
jgi:hypothetical protein